MTYNEFRKIERVRDIFKGMTHVVSDLEAYRDDHYDAFYEIASGEKKCLDESKLIPLSEIRKDIEILEQMREKYGHHLIKSVSNIKIIEED